MNPDPEDEVGERRAQLRESWEGASAGWGRQADSLRPAAMPVSGWMIEHAALQPGQRVLELAAGPGDTGFMAAELIAPGGTLISSDGAQGMLGVARERAAELGVENVEFKQLELEWIDLPTADVDVVLCRWGLMLCVDPAAALLECRRVLRPGGRLALAVWDLPERNPSMTAPLAATLALGYGEAPEPGGPGPFALSAPGALQELLENAGFLDVVIETVSIERVYPSVPAMIGETVDLSMMFGRVWRQLDGEARRAVTQEISERLAQYVQDDGALRVPGQVIAAVAEA
jgi:SAM-dependent methyltransferase